MTKSPGSRDPRGRRRKPKATPPPLDDHIKIWVPGPGAGIYNCTPTMRIMLARIAERRAKFTPR